MNSHLQNALASNPDLDPTILTTATTFEEAGLDSLAIVELSIQLSDSLGCMISEDEILDTRTIGGLDNMLQLRSDAACGLT